MEKGFQRKVKVRIVSVALLLTFCGGAILARLYYLQVVYHQKLSSRAASQIYEEVSYAPRRGDITDRRGRKLAVNVEVESVFGVPSRVKDPVLVSRRLSRATGRRAEAFLTELRKERSFVWLQRRISPDLARAIRDLGIEGIGFMKENRRYYPQRELAAQVIGMAGMDNQGLEGVELAYDDVLLREAVRLMVEKDARGRDILISGPPREILRKGVEVRLTIDEVLQHLAQNELARGVREAGAKGGNIVVLDPGTGEVLAMANLPYFNPNEFQRYGPRYFRNRPVGDLAEPGSILKPVLLAAALDEGAIELGSIFDCENGRMRFMGRVLRDVHPHRWLDATGVIVHSSNIGATKIALELGPDRYYRHLRRFGFGERTGIDVPGEAPGLLRAVPEWSGLSISALAIGQEISVTAIQMASAYAALANGGTLYRPYVVRKVIDGEGRTVRDGAPDVVRQVISPRTSRRVREVLAKVVSRGTGQEAAVEGYRVAGKTGTAQKYDSKEKKYSSEHYLASFAGFAPAETPRIVVVVMVDEPNESIWGGSVAAPVFRRFVERALRYLNVPPSSGNGVMVLKS